ncbi:RNA polymerase sigma factor [Sphingomonas sp. PP-CC-3G-468]|uniref:RNA polymerase sigma factor n=1 Tax=Sphingomonas sp. PP-CC-3G-468 TaxID=2135656 RepID=UPI00104D5FA8|nr:RNA polymerase sigma factor [Sphingomonas sp. PP-CC-3G-468]TCM04763.1 RNA polymerase sigma-70 factor (ECF subfamily) [Sphingomonas sp. PP-CC-3G-468]
MPIIRPIDRWFVEEVLPFERDLLDAAYRLCRGTDEARDLVQDVLARMLSTEAWGAISSPKTYMMRMMRNLVIDRLRRAKIIDFRHFVDFENFDAPDDTPDQHRIAEDRQQLDDLARAIRALPDKCRIVFERCRVDGQSPRQIADELGVSLSTLEKRLARAVYLLTQALEPRRRDTYQEQEPASGRPRHVGLRALQ